MKKTVKMVEVTTNKKATKIIDQIAHSARELKFENLIHKLMIIFLEKMEATKKTNTFRSKHTCANAVVARVGQILIFIHLKQTNRI